MNIKKGIKLLLTILLPMFLVSCVQIPFDKFIINEKTEDEIDIANIKSLKEEEIIINNNVVKSISETTSQLFEDVLNKEYYLNNYSKNDYLDIISKYFPEDVYISIKNNKNNPINQIGENIYFSENNFEYYNVSVVNAGYNIDNELYATIDVYAVGDTDKFLSNTVKVEFNKDYLITNITIISENDFVKNTRNSLNENSLLNEELTEEISVINSVFEKIKNEELYEDIKNNQKPENKIDEFIEKNIEIEEYNLEDFKEIFLINKGKFDRYFITNYEVDDVENLALSHFNILFINNENEEIEMTIVYSRVTKSIIKSYKNES